MRLDHAIFQGPLETRIELADMPTPAGYRSWADGKDLPATLKAWKVQSGELMKEVDYGLVSDPYGFEDSPDAEWISSGSNSKGPNSMAIGRQGNFFLWGFAGDPTQMTESARRVFLNSLVWMKQFDGKVPLAEGRGQHQARDWLLTHVTTFEAYASDQNLANYMRDQIPQALLAAAQPAGAAMDFQRLLELTREKLEFLHPVAKKVKFGDQPAYDSEVIDIDPILDDMGVSNRKPEFFELFADLLSERGAEDTTVKELADRYLPAEAPRDEEGFAKWLAEHRDRLYFSDVFGYRWFIAPEPLPPAKGKPKAAPPAGVSPVEAAVPTGAGDKRDE